MSAKKAASKDLSDRLYSLAILIALISMIVLSGFVIAKKTTSLGAPSAPKTIPHHDDFQGSSQ